MMGHIHAIKWSLFIIIASLLTWRIIVINLAEHFALHDTPESAARALAWYPTHPKATLDQALSLLQSDPQAAESLLLSSIRANPANGRAYIVLGRLWNGQGKDQQSVHLVRLASRLAPMQSAVQLEIGAFWLTQGQTVEALAHWNTALTLRPALQSRLFPLLFRLVDNAQLRPAFATLINDRPEWWLDFFRYVSIHAENINTVQALYQLIREQGHGSTAEERRYYIARLQREGHWMVAYLTWLNSLEQAQFRMLGNLYNGRFELTLADEDFGWRTPQVKGASVETAFTPGTKGSKALRVHFHGERVPFRHLYQNLLLTPGRYQLSGLLKLDNLQNPRGVQWVLQCKTGNKEVLGTSERFLGKTDWQPFSTVFQVPPQDCQVQELRLILPGRFGEEFRVQGTVWFDDMIIRRKKF